MSNGNYFDIYYLFSIKYVLSIIVLLLPQNIEVYLKTHSLTKNSTRKTQIWFCSCCSFVVSLVFLSPVVGAGVRKNLKFNFPS